MVRINNDVASYVPPYTVVVLDTTDANYYADFMDNMKEYARIVNLNLAKTLSDALFVVHNYCWKSLEEMNELDAGYDVRVYDAKFSCVHASHTVYKDKWFGN